MEKTSKILITGASGMVGSAIVRKLLFMGYTNLLGSYHSSMPDAAIFSNGNADQEIPQTLKLVKVDLRDQSAVNRVFTEENPAYVFIAAARVGGIHANNTYPARFIYDNLTIQGNIIHTAYRAGVKRLLFLGSSCIYPKLAPQPMQEAHLLTGLLEPTNEPYAIAKITGIKMCESYNRQYGTRFMAVMPTNLYGTNDNFDLTHSHVLPALIRKFHLARLATGGDRTGIIKDEARFGPIPADIKNSLDATLSNRHSSVIIWGTGSPKREFLHVDDMANACVHVMNLDEETASKMFLSYPKPCFVNVGSGIDGTIQELAETVRDVVGFSGEVTYDNSKPDGAPQKLLDVSILEELGWRPSIELTKGIRQTYEWYLERLKN